MKVLKFANDMPERILSGEKTATWRINDEKNISVGDDLSLCRPDGKEFTRAKVIFVRVAAFEELSDDVKISHEKYKSDKEMYDTFSGFYKMEVTPKTKVKIIKFKLIK